MGFPVIKYDGLKQIVMYLPCSPLVLVLLPEFGPRSESDSWASGDCTPMYSMLPSRYLLVIQLSLTMQPMLSLIV